MRLGLLLIALLLAGLARAEPGPMVTIGQGQLRGAMTADGALFLGIPFAQPPLGALRWRPPVPARPWQGVFPADQSGPPCMQDDLGWNHQEAIDSREDCLTLDVSTPQLHPRRPLPVMVWIHGGANWAGSGSGFSRSPIIRHDVLLVTVHYRLGVFGFLAHPSLRAESPFHSSGNYGLLDQIAALAWVRDSIAAFGGDPGNVTIFGESAGGQDVGLLRLSPLARGLFRRAIEESGTAGFGLPARLAPENEALGEAVQTALGADSIAGMRAASGQDLLRAQRGLSPVAVADRSFLWLQPMVDGWVIPAPPDVMPPAGTPLILGSNARELALYGDLTSVLTARFGPQAAAMRALYQDLATPRLGDLATELAADLTFRCPSIAVAQREQAAGAAVWLYHYDVSPVAHASELPQVFAADGVLQSYWTNFAKSGDPNRANLAPWPAFTAERPAFLEFTDTGPRVGEDLRGPICRHFPAL